MATKSSAGSVVKIIELVGSSSDSFSDDVRNAVKTAARTVRNIKGSMWSAAPPTWTRAATS